METVLRTITIIMIMSIVFLLATLIIIDVRRAILEKRWNNQNPEKVKRLNQINDILNKPPYRNIEDRYSEIRWEIDSLNKEKDYVEKDSLDTVGYKIKNLKKDYMKIKAYYKEKIQYLTEKINILNERDIYTGKRKGKKK